MILSIDANVWHPADPGRPQAIRARLPEGKGCSSFIKSAEPLIPAVSRHDGEQLALDGGLLMRQVSITMRQASTKTTELYYYRSRADPAFTVRERQ
jgi:hypothetical protein